MSKLACRADLWYNKLIKLFDRSGAGNTLRSGYNLYRRSHHGHFIPSRLALQAPLCFPLDGWRKVLMAPRKGTPEYEAWKNSPEYAERNKKIAASKKGNTFFSAEAKANMSDAHKVSYANLTDEEKAKRRVTNNLVTGNGEIWRGRKHTEETKAKLAIKNKGKEPPNKGKPMSDEQKKKLSEATKGRQISDIARAKISAAHKGKKRPELGPAISERLKGHKVSDETKAKIKEARKKQEPTFLGRKHSPESKAKMSFAASKAQKARYAAMSSEDLDALTERRMKSIHLKNTKPEIFVSRQLDMFNVHYQMQKHIGRYIVDFFLPEQNLIIEVNGCYWHACEQCGFGDANTKRKDRDKVKLPFLEKAGYMVVVLWEHDLRPFMEAEAKEQGKYEQT